MPDDLSILTIRMEYTSPAREFQNTYQLPAGVGGYIFRKDEDWITDVDIRAYRFCQQFQDDFRKVNSTGFAGSADKYDALEKRVKALELKLGKLKKNESDTEQPA